MVRFRGLVAIILMTILVGCSAKDCGTASVQPKSAYATYQSPDSLVANLARAYENMDLAEYRDRMLYSGKEPAADGVIYAPFQSIGAKEADDEDAAPRTHGYERELAIAGRMFGGEEHEEGTPPVIHISIEFSRKGEWTALDPFGEIMGDPYPAGAMHCEYIWEEVYRLKEYLPGSKIDAFEKNDLIDFYVVPVAPATGTSAGPVEYRLWKKWDMGY